MPSAILSRETFTTVRFLIVQGERPRNSASRTDVRSSRSDDDVSACESKVHNGRQPEESALLTMAPDRPHVDTVNAVCHYCHYRGPVTSIRNYSPSLESVATRVNARVGYSRSNRTHRKRKLASTL